MSDKNDLEKRIKKLEQNVEIEFLHFSKRIKKLEQDIETLLLLSEKMNARNNDIVQLADRVAQNSGISISQFIDISNWRVIK